MLMSSDKMPAPTTVNYDQYFKITPLFIENINIALTNVDSADSLNIKETIEKNEGVLPIAIVNEIIHKVSKMPYRYAKTFMNVIETNQSLYFVPVAPPKK